MTEPSWLGVLGERLGGTVEQAHLLPGGASKEAWAIDLRAGGEKQALLVRRAAGGVIHAMTLTLEHEFRVLEAAHEADVRVPRPVAYLGELGGREAFAMERVEGETIGRRIVRDPPPALPLQMADELARIHAIPPERLPFLAEGDPLERFREELDSVGEPHPAIELGLDWLRDRLPRGRPATFCHGDFRLGNLVVGPGGLTHVLDWEFAHLGDPVEDVAWPLVRAWRFGADTRRLGGVGDVEPYLERYTELTGREISLAELDVWEVFGNVKWAIGALTQSRRHLRGEERSVELAVLGRLAAEMEYELLRLLDAPEGAPAPATPVHDRPTPRELVEAVREFVERELLPTAADHRLRFRTLVALNALGIAERELAEHPEPEPDWELARRIRAGDVPADALARIRADVEAKLRVASPRTLDRDP